MSTTGKAKNALEARIEGEDAYFHGLSESANPYEVDDDRHLSWNDGYNDALDDSEGGFGDNDE